MADTTGIRIARDTLARLNAARVHPRETHDDVLRRLLSRKNGQKAVGAVRAPKQASRRS